MKKMIIPSFTIIIIICFMLMQKATAQVPSPPCVFYGYVNSGGKPAQDGLNITAVISGTTLNWTTQTNNGTYGWPLKGSSSLTIPSDDPGTPEKDGGVTGNRVEFYFEGIKMNQTATFESSGVKKTDLSISETIGSTPDPYPPYTLPTVIAIGLGLSSGAVFWIHRKRNRTRNLSNL